jgi:hypothetical protein
MKATVLSLQFMALLDHGIGIFVGQAGNGVRTLMITKPSVQSLIGNSGA